MNSLQEIDERRQFTARVDEEVVDYICREKDIPVIRQFIHDHA